MKRKGNQKKVSNNKTKRGDREEKHRESWEERKIRGLGKNPNAGKI